MRAVRATEGVIYVVVGELCQGTSKALVIGFFLRMKSQIFEQQRLTAFETR